jgi:hypothetical protein
MRIEREMRPPLIQSRFDQYLPLALQRLKLRTPEAMNGSYGTDEYAISAAIHASIDGYTSQRHA